MMDTRRGITSTAYGGKCAQSVLAKETGCVLVQEGYTDNRFFGYEVYRCEYETNEVYFLLSVDGDDEGYFESLEKARAYANNLFGE